MIRPAIYLQRAGKPDKKDRKSLSQNLFDTTAIKNFERKSFGRHLRSSAAPPENANKLDGLNLDGSPASVPERRGETSPSPTNQSRNSASSSPAISEEALPSFNRRQPTKDKEPPSSGVRIAAIHSEMSHTLAKVAKGRFKEVEPAWQNGHEHSSTESRLAIKHQPGVVAKGQSKALEVRDGALAAYSSEANNAYLFDASQVPSNQSSHPPIVKNSINYASEGEHSSQEPAENSDIAVSSAAACLAPMSILALSALTQMAGYVESEPQSLTSASSFTSPDPENVTLQLQTISFVHRSIHFSLSNAQRIVDSFQELDALCLGKGRLFEPISFAASIKCLGRFISEPGERVSFRIICNSLCTALETFFIPHSELQTLRSPSMYDTTGSTEAFKANCYLSNEKLTKIILICVVVLIREEHPTRSLDHSLFSEVRKNGFVTLTQSPSGYHSPDFDKWTTLVDELDSEPAIRLMTRLAEAVAARVALDEMSLKIFGVENHPQATKSVSVVLSSVIDAFFTEVTDGVPPEAHPWNPFIFLIERLRTVILQHWDGTATLKRWSAIGGALIMMKLMGKHEIPR